MNEGIPDTGYDKKLNVNYGILKETLKELDYDDFLRACPRYPEFITEIDVNKLLTFRGVAVNFSGEEVDIPDNLMDYRQFVDAKGKIIGAITREIKRGDPRNLDYGVVQESMMDMNNLTEKVIEKTITSSPYMQKIQEILSRKMTQEEEEQTVSNSELTETVNELTNKINEMTNEFIEIKKKMEKTKPAETIDSPKIRESEDTESSESVPMNTEQISKIEMSVVRTWLISVNDADDSVYIQEKREKEEGGDINVEMTDGSGSVIWKVKATKLGHSALYERIKNIMIEFFAKGEVSTNLTYSLPNENEERNFTPEIKQGKVWATDSWSTERGLFNKKYEKSLTFVVGRSSWKVEVETKMYDVKGLKSALMNLMDMILLSGETEARKDDSRPLR
jgi:hypothetical protein